MGVGSEGSAEILGWFYWTRTRDYLVLCTTITLLTYLPFFCSFVKVRSDGNNDKGKLSFSSPTARGDNVVTTRYQSFSRMVHN
ncbi:hypothetical protein M747DRAFT_123538 [Aspergillus niger ATCC 13496]|uniref:Uncharacterized protein n=1 Tax=Aspergillus niger ATCC 13496 TaxID=1353008 RepID=A0A370BRF2_ASPNG|nr:hypothetical protein M747DRAFT_123538 [Aspergillus niger ATCC 13496]